MKANSVERRLSKRYGLTMNLECQIFEGIGLNSKGSGWTIDISRTGVRFRCSRDVPYGTRMMLIVDWPARFDGLYTLELCLNGEVIRSRNGEIVMGIRSWQFRANAADGSVVPNLETATGWAPRGKVREREERAVAAAVR